ncbi:MAG: orotate phosphoribosyltransferase [Flavobacteriales bacterium]|nr:orotate phosphoribosyltransferase [Flavobacteriales bacterium]
MDILNPELAAKIADNLLRIEAVKLRPDAPFTWASGWRSPIYCDNRKTLSFPDVRQLIAHGLADVVRNHYPKATVIAGVATGAIAAGILVAELLDLPFVYVRPEPKKHGMGNQVEGFLPQGAKVAVIEDLISTGGSSLKAVEALRSDGAEVLGMAAIFTYGFPQADEAFRNADCKIITLSNYDNLLPRAKAIGQVSEDQLQTLREWRRSPATWGL